MLYADSGVLRFVFVDSYMLLFTVSVEISGSVLLYSSGFLYLLFRSLVCASDRKNC